MRNTIFDFEIYERLYQRLHLSVEQPATSGYNIISVSDCMNPTKYAFCMQILCMELDTAVLAESWRGPLVMNNNVTMGCKYLGQILLFQYEYCRLMFSNMEIKCHDRV